VAIDFSARTLITNPTVYSLGRGVIVIGLILIAVGAISYLTTDILMPAPAWFAMAVPTMVVGTILIASSKRKR